jgi:hypothetical protein
MGESREPAGEIVLYQIDDGRTRVECRFAEEAATCKQYLQVWHEGGRQAALEAVAKQLPDGESNRKGSTE